MAFGPAKAGLGVFYSPEKSSDFNRGVEFLEFVAVDGVAGLGFSRGTGES